MQQTRRRILCVDDNADIREMLTTLLGIAGYDATPAATVHDARLYAAAGGFDLFIIDAMWPPGAGLELCRDLRRRHPHTPVIVYSGDATERHRRDAAEAGAAACVAKPHINHLVSAVNRLSSQAAPPKNSTTPMVTTMIPPKSM